MSGILGLLQSDPGAFLRGGASGHIAMIAGVGVELAEARKASADALAGALACASAAAPGSR